MGRGPLWYRPVSLIRPLWDYCVHYYGRRGWKSRAEVAAQLRLDVFIMGVLVASVLTGRFGDLAVLWVLSALVAASFLAYTFDHLPHRPQD